MKTTTSQPKSDHHNLDALLDRHAPMKSRPGVIERYPTDRPQLLAQRVKMTVEETVAALKAGLLRPLSVEKSQAGEVGGFDGSDLDRVRRGAILAGLEQIGRQNPGLDSHDLAAAADRAMSFAARTNRPVIELNAADKAQFRQALADARTVRFSAAEGDRVLARVGARLFNLEVPLTGKVARDRYVKKIRDEDEDRRDANLLRAGVAGAAAGALIKAGPLGKLSAARRALAGATAGAGGVLAIRRATEGSRDAYGERTRETKRAESIPAVAGAAAAGAAGLAAAKRLIAARRMRFSRAEVDILLAAHKEATGGDLRLAFGSRVYDPKVIQFAIAGIGPAVAALLRRGSKFTKGALLPGTTSRKIIDSGVAGAGVGAVGGGVQAITDGDPDTGALAGVLRGAAGGAAVGGAVGLIRGSTPFVSGTARQGLEAAAEKLRRKYQGRGFVV